MKQRRTALTAKDAKSAKGNGAATATALNAENGGLQGNDDPIYRHAGKERRERHEA
ncbi:MAG: hypothetical protein ACYS9X_12850 [Planctomycetota bacterium]